MSLRVARIPGFHRFVDIGFEHVSNESKPQEVLNMNAKDNPTAAQKAIGDFAPRLVDYTDRVLFGEVWEGSQLSQRDRSLITCAALIATGKTEQMDFHFPKAIDNGVTQKELVEVITHLAFYVGWPAAMSATMKAKALFGTDPSKS